MNSWGKNININIFGESHSKVIGCVLDGIPAGVLINEKFIQSEMNRRLPGKNIFSTKRKEDDVPKILSGVKDGYANGSSIVMIIENKDIRSSDYKNILRPSHADLTGLLKYGAKCNLKGGGRFSGRLTAPLVFAGAICKTILKKSGVEIYGRISSIGKQKDEFDLTKITSTTEINKAKNILRKISKKEFASSDQNEKKFKDEILNAKKESDSIGGVVDIAVYGVIEGLGEPFFDSVESVLSSLYFSVPAVKGVSFGAGFNISSMRGSEANDAFDISVLGRKKKIVTTTNNSGGILGGITNGMPLLSSIYIKPTASIGKTQDMISYEIGKNNKISFKKTKSKIIGRHDPCIVQRAVVVLEAVTAIGLLDLFYECNKNSK